MAKKNTIQIDYDWDFLLIGVATTVRDYQLCWQLNRLLDIKLKKQVNIELNLKKKNKLAEFCHFRFNDEMDKFELHVLGNKFMGEHLVPEYKMMDYLLLIKGLTNGKKKDDFLVKLKSLPSITAAVEVNPDELKTPENLILE